MAIILKFAKSLVREGGGRNKSRENPGIAKKGGGGLTPAKICLVDLT